MMVMDVEGRCFSKAQPHHPDCLAPKGHNASLDRAQVTRWQIDQYQESELRNRFSGWIACCCQHLAAVERDLIGGDVVCWRPAMEACIGDLGDLETVGMIRGSIQCFGSTGEADTISSPVQTNWCRSSEEVTVNKHRVKAEFRTSIGYK